MEEIAQHSRMRRKARSPSHYELLLIIGLMASSPLIQPGADIIGVAYRRHDTERGAAERRVHLGDQLLECIFLGAERAGEIAIEPMRGTGCMTIMPISA